MRRKNFVENANALVSQCPRKRIPQKPSSVTRRRMCLAGVSRGQDRHAGTSAFRARRAREDGGWDGAARRAPRLACPRVILPPSHCSPVQPPRGDAEAKMCFILPIRPQHACNAKGGTRWARLCAGPQPIWRSYTTMASATKLLMETSTCRGNPVIIINMPVPSLVAPSWSGVINTFAYE